MPFPISERVQYRHNPIRTVVCQLRFPTILKVEAFSPVEFQEAIRSVFPKFKKSSLLSGVQIPAEMENAIPVEMKQFLSQEGGGVEFSSLDDKKTVSLNNDSLSLTTSEYAGWEEFVGDFRGPLDALVQVYGPDTFTRIGLRYQNVILLSELELPGVKWSELINPQLAGVLADEVVGDSVDNCLQMVTFRLKDGTGYARIQHGLGTEENRQEEAYLIDCDFYVDQPQEVGNALNILGQFNQRSGHFFRWSIQKRLHEAMGSKEGSWDDNR